MIQLDWTFDNKLYYNYEVYASQIKGFEPDTTGYTNRIYVGQASSLLHEVKPMQTWYYRVRAGNTHDNYNEFSNEVSATTRKLSDAAEYFEEAAIGHAVIRDLDADKINVGKVKGQYIEAKNLVVVDGNSQTTLNIDSFGNVHVGATTFTLKGKSLESIIGGEIDNITQLEIFNKLTNNGLAKGLYMVGNELYLNASYIKTGTLEGQFINGRNLTVRDNDGYITLQVDSNGKVNIRANELSIGDKNNYESVLTSDQQAVFDALTGNRNCGIYLRGSRLYINADYIDTGTILCDKIGASSSNPRILLFSGNGAECAIDATALNGVGIGKSIRFQYDRSHYVAVDGSSINFYIGSTVIYNNFSRSRVYFYQDDIRWDSAQFDMSGALRLYTESGETGFVAWDDGNAAIYCRGRERHAFYSDGSKNGGSIEIDGTIFGMSPVDSPQTLIEDILFDVEVEETGTIVKLDSTYAKTISRYAVFPSNGKVEVVEKKDGYFKVSGYTGKVDFSVKGSRIDKEHEYFKIMGGEEQHGNF